MGTGKGGEVMKISSVFIMSVIYIFIFLFFVFISFSRAQDLFDRAEIEFDIDYIDIDKVKVIGGTINGQVMAVWMKSGSVLTKTLSSSKIKYNDDSDISFSYRGISDNDSESKFTKNRIPIEELRKKSVEELISITNDLINGEWGDHTTFRLFDVIFALKLEGNRGPEMVKLTMDVINANLKYENRPRRLLAERDMMLQFAEGDEQLTQTVNDFLEEKGFNKEN